MTAPAWYNNGKKLGEGDVLSFAYRKLIKLSDGEEYMVFEDPFSIRHMIPYVYYKDYCLEPGIDVVCRVDRINCTGRVFLEPEHPVYIPGNIEKFSISSVFYDESAECDFIRITVYDVFGNEIGCEISRNNTDNMKPGDIVELKIAGLKKGKPILTF